MNLRTIVYGLCPLLLLSGFGGHVKAEEPAGGRDGISLFQALRPGETAAIIPSQSQFYRALESAAPAAPWAPGSSRAKELGPARLVYPKVAPAIVLVRTEEGHGTGFLIDKDGWIVTNHHVIAGAGPGGQNGAKRATVYLGRLRDGFMEIVEKGLAADVYKESEDKDLALLKLVDTPPADLRPLPVVGLAQQAAAVGDDCVSIGHPRSSTLWTARSGEVSGVGQWPRDRIDMVIANLASSGKQRDDLLRVLKGITPRKVLISTCGLNPGDSGGPLVDARGQLIAVSFAIPRSEAGEGIHVDKFSYHVHLDEVKSFLAEKPKAPEVRVPDPWPEGVYAALMDLDDDGTPDTLAYALSRGQPPTGMLMDLKQESDPNLKASDLRNPARRKDWHFQFAIQRAPQARAFYDTDDDGKIDLILTDSRREGVADTALRLKNGTWVRESAEGRPLIDPTLISNKNLRKRFVKITRRLQREGTDE